MSEEWIDGSLESIPVVWLNREVETAVSEDKEIASIDIAGYVTKDSVSDGSGYFDDYFVYRNLELEKLYGTNITHLKLNNLVYTSDEEYPVFGAVKQSKIERVYIVAGEDIIGDDTDYIQLQIIRKSDEALIATKTFVEGTNANAYETVQFGPVNEDNAFLEFGDGVSLKIVGEGAGMNLPEYVLIIEWDIA